MPHLDIPKMNARRYIYVVERRPDRIVAMPDRAHDHAASVPPICSVRLQIFDTINISIFTRLIAEDMPCTHSGHKPADSDDRIDAKPNLPALIIQSL